MVGILANDLKSLISQKNEMGLIISIIELINPKFILLLGSTATKAILSTSLSITKLRGNWHGYKSLNLNRTIECLATYHPAFLLRSPNYKKQSWEDLQIFQQKILDENL